MEEITEAGTTQTSRYFVWGQDLSQSLQGAGGIGGLIATVDGAAAYLYCFDANGNVGQVVNAADGAIAARYEYDPYGKPIKAEGAYAVGNPFRFSTKYHDDETGQVYYGYRYYSAELGRWLSRDPAEEGFNHYAFVGNNSINAVDILGLWKIEEESKGKERLFYLKETSEDTIKTLAEIVGLEASEADKWAKTYMKEGTSLSVDTPNNCKVSVPNVWISADLLQGGGLWDSFVNTGGSIGRFIGTDVFTRDFKIVKPNTIMELRGSIKNDQNNLWGIVVFGHGVKGGDILAQADVKENTKGEIDNADYGRGWIYQSDLRNDISQTGYKLSKIYMMQCYSKAGQNGQQWEKLTTKDNFFGYHGMDFLGIDLYFF